MLWAYDTIYVRKIIWIDYFAKKINLHILKVFVKSSYFFKCTDLYKNIGVCLYKINDNYNNFFTTK